MYNVAIVGSTGNVGRKFLEILEERNFIVTETATAPAVWYNIWGRVIPKSPLFELSEPQIVKKEKA